MLSGDPHCSWRPSSAAKAPCGEETA